LIRAIGDVLLLGELIGMRVHPDLLVNPISGESVKILRRPLQDGESVEVLIELAEVGSGPGPHLHPSQTERFQVVRGLLEMTIGENHVTAVVGDEIVVPAGTTHHFRALEAGTQLHTDIQPGAGFEVALEDVFELFDRGHVGPDGIADPAAFNACFVRHQHVMVSARPRQS
jgi:quercetin dioxygenase-like cupin family protein